MFTLKMLACVILQQCMELSPPDVFPNQDACDQYAQGMKDKMREVVVSQGAQPDSIAFIYKCEKQASA